MSVREKDIPYPEGVYPYFDLHIASKAKSRYGDQELFAKWKAKTIQETVQALHNTKIAGSQNHPSHFLARVLEDLGKKRGVIAKTQGSDKWNEFGIDRRVQEQYIFTILLNFQYRESNQKLRKFFYDFFPFFQQEKFPVHRVEINTSYSRFTMEKLDQKELCERMEEARTTFVVKKGTPLEEIRKIEARLNDRVRMLNALGLIQEVIRSLKLPDIQLLPSPSVGSLQYFIGTIETKVGGQWRVLTRQVAWIKQEEPGYLRPEAIDYFIRYGFTAWIHTPKEEINPLIESLEGKVKDLIYCEDPSVNRNTLSFLVYRLFHATPYLRGSASIVEILHEAICKLKGLPLQTVKDEDALICPFIERYMRLSQ